MAEFQKVKAKDITLDPNHRWDWHVRKGGGYAVCERNILPDGRIQLCGVGGCFEMVTQPNDLIWARREVHGYWNDKNEWVVPNI